MSEGYQNVAEETAEKLRQEPYHLFRNDCLTKSIRFRSEYRRKGIKVYLIWCALGLAEIKLPFSMKVSIPYFTHFWGEIEGKRYETSRPLGSGGIFGIIPSQIRPILTVRF